MLLQNRNHLRFSDGGLSMSVSDKAPMLLNIIQMFRARYDRRKREVKSSMNVEMAMGGMGTVSEFFIINGLYMSNF